VHPDRCLTPADSARLRDAPCQPGLAVVWAVTRPRPGWHRRDQLESFIDQGGLIAALVVILAGYLVVEHSHSTLTPGTLPTFGPLPW
jgi:hypothetical protein